MPDIALPSEWQLDLTDADLQAIVAALDEEVERGLRRAPGADLAMLPAYVGRPRKSARGKVLCLDAGGTNVRGALVTVGPEEITIGEVHHARLPGATEPVDRATFFQRLAGLVAPAAGRVRRVGFCFSYPAEVFPDGDAVLLRWTKEVKAPSVVGAKVGQGLSEGLVALGRRGPFRVVVLNDTVTTLIAATRDPATAGCTGFIGVVVGTGTNMAAFEPPARARRRAPSWTRGPLAFNLESGNFSRFPRGPLDERLAQGTQDPDRQWFEKAVSGQYLGDLCYLALRDLAARGAGPPTLAEGARALPPPPTEALSRVLEGPPGDTPWERWLASHPETLPLARAVMRALVERSARLVAAGLAALVARAAQGARGPAGPIAVAAEGSVFWGVPGYRDLVDATLARLTPTPARLVHIADANLRGAALAALSAG